MNYFRFYTSLLSLLFLSFFLGAQPPQTSVKVIVAPDYADWLYKLGEQVTFTIRVYKNDNLVKNAKISYEIGLEKQSALRKETIISKEGIVSIPMSGLTSPGFLRCIATVEVDGKNYRALATAGFSPEQITPTVTEPDDFDTYWKTSLEALKGIPLDPIMTLVPEQSTSTVNVYHVNFQNNRLGSRIYGMLAVPKKEGTYPALLHIPGAGIRPFGADVGTAEKGVITLQIGIHGIPANLDPEVYQNLANGALSQYYLIHADSKDNFYYKRVILGCIRANDFLTSLPAYDGSRLAVMGGSQGGALAIATASLDHRVRWMGVLYPSLSDITGTLHQRAGGSAYYVLDKEGKIAPKPAVLTTLSYFDSVNFAKRLRSPGYYTWGFNDESCPPTAMHAVYNSISAPKEFHPFVHMGHWYSGEHRAYVLDWLYEKLTNNN